MLAVMALYTIVACGEDGEKNESTKKVDGVNVVIGKKLMELKVMDNSNSVRAHYKVEYDSKGRLSKINGESFAFDYYGWNSTFVYNFPVNIDNCYPTGEYKELAKIDYELRIVTLFFSSSKLSYNFSLNNDGYISQIGTTVLNYDSNGYLTGVDEVKGISTLVYDSNDLIKASVSEIAGGNISLFYITYGNQNNEGDLYIKVNRSDDKKNYDNALGVIDAKDAICLIAYQSGLFGKVSKSVLHLSNKNEAQALLGYEAENGSGKTQSLNGKISFVSQ